MMLVLQQIGSRRGEVVQMEYVAAKQMLERGTCRRLTDDELAAYLRDGTIPGRLAVPAPHEHSEPPEPDMTFGMSHNTDSPPKRRRGRPPKRRT